MAGELTLDPPQPALAGATVYAVLSRGGTDLATVPLGTVAPDGTVTPGDVPTSIAAGTLVSLAYRQLGASPDPDPGIDPLIAAATIRWAGVYTPPTPPVSPVGDVLKSGLSWLTGQLATHAAQVVTYSRGPSVAAVRATFGEKLLKLDDGAGGVVMEWTDIDFLIPAADLILDGVATTPERGDVVRVPDEATNTTRIYEVAPIGSESAWRWSDPHRSMIRVHAKFVEDEAGC